MPTTTTQRALHLRAVHLRVRGRVQGVGFRYYTRSRAEALGLRGFVRNLPDGSVEAQAEGDAEALEAFVAQVRTGPRLGLVRDCVVQWSTPTGHYHDFDILHG